SLQNKSETQTNETDDAPRETPTTGTIPARSSNIAGLSSIFKPKISEITKPQSPFKFFGDQEDDEEELISSQRNIRNELVTPLKNYRSGAPTPDTAIATRITSLPLSVPSTLSQYFPTIVRADEA